MGGIFLDFGAFKKRRDRRMVLEGLEQLVGSVIVLRKVGNQAADADRNALLVGVDEAHAGHALGDGAGGFDDDAFVALEIEARFDRLARQEVHFLDRERDVFGLRRRRADRRACRAGRSRPRQSTTTSAKIVPPARSVRTPITLP